MLNVFDKFDLTWLHVSATVAGIILCIVAAQMMWQDPESQRDCLVVRWGRRIMYPALALAFLWSLDYAHAKAWTPWAPDVAIILAIDFIIAFRVMALRIRQIEAAARGWARPNGVDQITPSARADRARRARAG